MSETVRAWAFDALVIFGIVVMTLGVLGTFRMPDLYTRLHAASKSVFLGVMVIAVAGMVVAERAIITRLVLICLVLLITTPVASHVIGRAGFLLDERATSPGKGDHARSDTSEDESAIWSS